MLLFPLLPCTDDNNSFATTRKETLFKYHASYDASVADRHTNNSTANFLYAYVDYVIYKPVLHLSLHGTTPCIVEQRRGNTERCKYGVMFLHKWSPGGDSNIRFCINTFGIYIVNTLWKGEGLMLYHRDMQRCGYTIRCKCGIRKHYIGYSVFKSVYGDIFNNRDTCLYWNSAKQCFVTVDKTKSKIRYEPYIQMFWTPCSENVDRIEHVILLSPVGLLCYMKQGEQNS